MDKKKEATTKKNDSDFEHLKVWKDNPDLKYYLSEKHWNYHVNQLLYAYLTSRYEGNEVGVYINLGLLNGSAFNIDYNQSYGVMFNEAYSFCRYVLTTPAPETEITFLESKAESLCSVKLAKPIIAYNILVMTGLVLCFSNDQNEAVGRFLRRLSGYNHTHYFGDEFHHFENYIKIGLNVVAGIMIDGQLQHPGKLRPGYDYKGHDEYLRKTLPWYRVSAEKLEERVETSSDKTNGMENILNLILNKVEEQAEIIRKIERRSFSHYQKRRSDYWAQTMGYMDTSSLNKQTGSTDQQDSLPLYRSDEGSPQLLPSPNEEQNVQLPDKLNIGHAPHYFKKAIGKKWIEVNDGKYRWIGFKSKNGTPNATAWAYFCDQAYEYNVFLKNDISLPADELEEFFNMPKGTIYKSNYRIAQTENTPDWKVDIDTFYTQESSQL